MDNQKSNDGNARDIGREGAGSSMGKDTGKEAGKDFNKDLGKDGNKPASELYKTADTVSDTVEPAISSMASSAHAGVDKVSDALSGASRRMDEKSRQLADAYSHFTETGRDYVRSSPATSVLVALAAGYTLSKLLSRRN
ncbi:MAG: hypothetical protein V4857_26140 [Pseudomonadota bacterium]